MLTVQHLRLKAFLALLLTTKPLMRINGSGLQDTNLAVTYINSIIVACLEQNCSMHCESLRAVRLGCKLAANNISTNLLTNGKHGLTLTPLIDTRTVGIPGERESN